MQTNKSSTNAKLSSEGATERRGSAAWEVRFLWLLVLVLLAYWGYGQIRNRVDPEVQRHVLKLLRKRYPNHNITLQSAHVIENKGIVLDGLRISLQHSEGLRDIVRLGRITALGNICLIDLMKGKLCIEKIQLDDLTVSVWPVDESTWSVHTLANAEPLPENLPSVSVGSGIVHILGDTASKEELIFHDLSASCQLLNGNQDPDSLPYEIKAEARSNSFDLLRVQLNVSRDKQLWNVEGEVANARLTQDLFKKLPGRSRESLKQLAGFSGIVSSTFSLKKPREGNLNFEVKRGDIHSGSLVHPRLPYPLDRLTGEFYCRNDILQLRNATAASGSAIFKLDADVYGENAPVPIVLKLQAQNLPIDDRLYQVLSPKLKEVWKKLEPSGFADGTVKLQYDGAQWKPEIEADIRDVAVRFASFPYPVTGARGHVSCNDHLVRTSNLQGIAGGAEASLVLLMQKRDNFWAYDATITTNQTVKIDDELLSALSPRSESQSDKEIFVRSLHPTGLMQVKLAKFVRNSANEEPYNSLQLEISDGAVSYDHFRYPISGVAGQVSIVNSQVTVKLLGHNDSASIRCSGTAQCGHDDLQNMKLVFDANNVSLEEELRLALPAGTRQLWDAVQPNGVVDQVSILLTKPSVQQPLDIGVTIEENVAQSGRVKNSAHSVTVRPKEIPYPLTDVRCRIEYQNGRAHINHLSGVHDVSKLSATGDFDIANDGTWNGIVRWLPESRLIVDQSLLSCLPNYLQQPILSTAFRGPVSVMGESHFASSASNNSLVVRECNLDLAIEEGRLGWGDIASGIRGAIHIHAIYDDQTVFAEGQLDLDSLSVYRVPVLNLKGPFAVQNGNIYLGRDSQPIKQSYAATHANNPFRLASLERPIAENFERPKVVALSDNARQDPNFLHPADDPRLAIDPSDINAACFGGQLYLHGTHEIATARSWLNIQLQEADLRETVMDLSSGANLASGKYWAECKLQGCLYNQLTLVGEGKAWLRRADLVKLPVMARLFRQLSIKEDTGGAFESGEIQFKIDGDQLPLKISLDGDIISMRGSGVVNMRQEIDLDMYAYVGKRSAIAAVLGPIVSHNDNASLMAVEVDGTLQAMNVRRGFNLINKNAAELFPERIFSAK